MTRMIAVLCICCILGGCVKTPAPPSVPPAHTETADLRGIWVSYLELDPVLRQGKAATVSFLDEVMNTCKQDGFNTVFLQVRAFGDAYYSSDVFPAAQSAAELLAEGFDPLAYAVQAAHAQELSLHAWINPYRIGDDPARAVCEDIYEWEGGYYYIPTSQTAQTCILSGVREVVSRYAVDGVQYDDYFYPSGISAQALPFETPSGSMSVAEYRRAAVSVLIAATCSAVHTRAGCLFGVSPAGNVARNREQLYADIPRFMAYTGYVDYICPQLYSGFENESVPFTQQAADYAALPRAAGVRLYAGLALYKTGEADSYAGTGKEEWVNGGDILARQLAVLRTSGYEGVAVFRYAHWSGQGGSVREAEKAAFQEVLNKEA